MLPSLRSAHTPVAATPSALADRWAETCPERLACSDQWGRESWSGRPAARLTWRELRERSVLLAARLSRLMLGPGSLVGLCLPNGSEWMVAFLAIERAGLTPCCLPVAASADDLAAAVQAAGIEAVVTQAAVGPLRPAETICAVAGGHYRLRYVLGFGPGLPDGVTDLDAMSGEGSGRPDLPPGAMAHPGRSRGLVTFERHAPGWRPVLRPHSSLWAATRVLVAALARCPAPSGRSAFAQDRYREHDLVAEHVSTSADHARSPESREPLITLISPDGLKAVVSGPMLSLATGCGIEAHGLFSRADLDRALMADRTARLVAPGWMEGALRRHAPTRRLILTHDAPARFPDADPGLDTVDLLALGESALVAAPRREGLAAALESPAAALGSATGVPSGSRSLLRLRIDPGDGRVHAGGPAAETSPMGSRPGAGAGRSVRDPAERDAPTPFRVERVSGRVSGILSLA